MKPTDFTNSAFVNPDNSAIFIEDSDFAARLRVQLCYLWRHRRLADLDNPVRFTEWVQWRKINDRDPRKPTLVDKVRVKHHVASALGKDWVTPTLFYGSALPVRPEWPKPFVVKARHGCQQHEFVRHDDADWEGIAARSRAWTTRPYGLWLDEWAYRDVPLGVIVEPFIGPDGELPSDYKIHVFGGRVECIQVDVMREHGHRRAFFDLNWNPIWTSPDWTPLLRPQTLHEMCEAAALLGRDFDFIRCDFYEIDGKPRFGELSFYPASGLTPLGDQFDFWLGNFWTRARQRLS